ncbi:hypothetical protein COV16_00050 [Candidatus Woesearchaeota archaeon CG10_big_fil_rev_8_21_14_0_10_34_8]|jgi:fluoride ion exporter CrcB/FEX|nr:MAG: hypothetical protein COV16_00050 [Candidatus Woesearchaeota archaeon CG10_big_fil_rev_8_21_14_0_10_34_8]
MNELILAGIFGFIGGVARASVGFLKALKQKKKFNLKYFLVSLFTSGIVGVFAGLLYDKNYKLTLIAGYAGTDLIESIYKMKHPKSTLFS